MNECLVCKEALKEVDRIIDIMERNRYRKRIGIGAVISHLTKIQDKLKE